MSLKKILRTIKVAILLALSVLVVPVIQFSSVKAATPTTQTISTSQSWTFPSGVNSVIIQAWGAGGGGSNGVGAAPDGCSGAGGGGGEFRQSVIISSGSNLTINIGNGGSPGLSGQSTTITGGNSSVIAIGGGGGSCGGAGGSGGSGGTGQIGFNGGAGYLGVIFTNASGSGGGGGSSAGTNSNGTDATGAAGAIAPTGGGNGGARGLVGGSSQSGFTPGGGGGGGSARNYPSSGSAAGASGANGQVIITYYSNGSGNYAYTSVATNINPIITISNTSNISLNVTPTTGGNMSYAADLITITTNDVSGYNLTINDIGIFDSRNNYLYNGTNLLCAAQSTAGSSTGWTGSLSPLGNGAYNGLCTTNTSGSWGFAVCTPGTGAPVKNLATGNYINGTTSAPANCPLTAAQSSGSQNIALSGAVNNIWSAMGGTSSVYTIQNKSGTASGDTYLINYAVALNTNQPSGNGTQGNAYNIPVIYTVTTN